MKDRFNPTPLTRKIRLSDQDIAQRLVVLEFEQQDADLLASLRPWAVSVADRFLQLFYDEQFSHAEFVQIIEAAGSNRDRLEQFQRQYLLELFNGMPDAAYVESRLRIGALHARIGVKPKWYVSSYALYEKHLYPMLRGTFPIRRGKGKAAVAALSKLLRFDKTLVLDMYIEGVTQEVRDAAVARSRNEENDSSQAEGLVEEFSKRRGRRGRRGRR